MEGPLGLPTSPPIFATSAVLQLDRLKCHLGAEKHPTAIAGCQVLVELSKGMLTGDKLGHAHRPSVMSWVVSVLLVGQTSLEAARLGVQWDRMSRELRLKTGF